MKPSDKLEIDFVAPDGSVSATRTIYLPDPEIAAAAQREHAEDISRMRKLAQIDALGAARQLIELIRRRDPNTRAMLKACHEVGQSRQIFELFAKASVLDAQAQDTFLSICIESGRFLRSEVGDDIVFIDALWKMLPRYEGPDVHLYRGEPQKDYVLQQHGISWSSDKQAASTYARGLNAMYQGGGLLLETVAPVEAIIAVAKGNNVTAWENEYLIDRRRLIKINVLERFPEVS